MQKAIVAVFILVLVALPMKPAFGQANSSTQEFDKIELMVADGKNIRETDVRIAFDSGTMRIVSARDGKTLKEWKRGEITAAEYSYTKTPRWKTGLGLGAAGFLFPPIWLVAIPLGFTKHRRHWVTVRTENDYAVLKVSKSIRKLFIPAFETSTGIKIEAVGDDK
jgi:hypothetical protein